MSVYTKLACFAGGALFGSFGIKLLSSKDAKRAYVHATAAGLRMKDTVMGTVTTVQENAADILASARELNEDRAAREAGLIVCADMMRSRTGQRMDAIASALPYVDYFFANFEEAAFLTSQPTLNAMGKALLDGGTGAMPAIPECVTGIGKRRLPLLSSGMTAGVRPAPRSSPAPAGRRNQ